MPIIEPAKSSPPVFPPTSNYPIAKYMDITKFISLLFKQSLFFCRLDKLEDKFEGVTVDNNFEIRLKYFNDLRNENFYDTPLNDEKILKSVTSIYDLENMYKSLRCINCWNKYNSESAAIWKIYSDFSKGILIKSSISRIHASLQNSEEELYISEIKYLNYKSDYMPDGNMMFSVIHKQKAYSFEDEIRLIYTVSPTNGFNYDWEKEVVPEGKYIKVDLNDLIEEIIVSPHSSKWYFELIKDLCRKYSLEVEVKHSDLTPF